jgi:lysophospholipase L1-like esterase
MKKLKNFIKPLLLVVIIFTYTFQFIQSATFPYDTARIFKAMAKAEKGGDFTIGVIGGSITAGTWASVPEKRWANLVTNWWKNNFPKANIKLVNAGFGGTGSDIGTFRVKTDLLKYHPDFVICEFAVNDAGRDTNYIKEMYEGVVRQILQDSAQCGLLLLMLKMEDGKTAQQYHKQIGNYYQLPMVSQADSLDDMVARDGYKLHDVFKDGVHPNDLGMSYVAKIITNELNYIFVNLHNKKNFTNIGRLPKPFVTDLYTNTATYSFDKIEPISASGWAKTSNSWTADKTDAELTFNFTGNAIGLTYSRFKDSIRGKADVWVDELPRKQFDSYWTETWGKGTSMLMVAEFLPSGKHTLHIKVSNENSPGSKGHWVEFYSIMKAEE